MNLIVVDVLCTCMYHLIINILVSNFNSWACLLPTASWSFNNSMNWKHCHIIITINVITCYRLCWSFRYWKIEFPCTIIIQNQVTVIQVIPVLKLYRYIYTSLILWFLFIYFLHALFCFAAPLSLVSLWHRFINNPEIRLLLSKAHMWYQ